MKISRLTAAFLSTCVIGAALPASAATFVYRQYVHGMALSPTSQTQENVANILVALAGATLPPGDVGSAYSYDLNQLLSVTGDSNFLVSGVSWSVTAGGLPSGLNLSGGLISGTPSSKNLSGSTFQVQASYKTKSGQQSYTIVVNGQPLTVTQVVGGMSYTCAITTLGGAKCWGDNSFGQLGNGTLAASPSPVDVVGLTSGVAQLSAGPMGMCAVTTTGAAKCWGSNQYGQLGTGDNATRTVPTNVANLSSSVAQISAGANASCAVTTSGALFCWGANNNGQLGDGSTTSHATPGVVTGLATGVAHVEVGSDHACALTTSGGVKCWGWNGYGQLGDSTLVSRSTPVDVSGLTAGVSRLDSSSSFNCVVTNAGGVKCWGWNAYGNLGDGTTVNQPTPVNVYGLASGVSDVQASSGTTCALTTTGGVKCWGFNGDGELANGSYANSSIPVSVQGLPAATAIGVGYWQVCAKLTDNTLRCWGYNGSGELGDGTTADSMTPVTVRN